jgi:hypothetical protein
MSDLARVNDQLSASYIVERELGGAGMCGATEPVQWVWVALAHAQMGDVEEMFVALRRALEARDFWLYTIILDPAWDRFRPDPRFTAIVREAGFA